MDKTRHSYLSTHEEFEGKGCEHVKPKTESRHVDNGVVLITMIKVGIFIEGDTYAGKVVEYVALRLVREHQVS